MGTTTTKAMPMIIFFKAFKCFCIKYKTQHIAELKTMRFLRIIKIVMLNHNYTK